jgi:hypothetical protein
MAVTVSPTSVLTRISDYRAANPSVALIGYQVISVAPRSVAIPGEAGGFFKTAYDPVNNKLLLDYSSTATD